MKDFELLIFDCDGVLVDSEPLSGAAHKNVYASHGVTLADNVMSACVGMKQKDIIARIAKETGFVLPESSIQQIWVEVKKLIHEKLDPTPGIIDFLRADRHGRCVASSSAMERIKLSLDITGVAAHFRSERVFNAAMVKNGKPAPDLFLHAAAQCGVNPGACAVFEDSLYGVQAAVAAGMVAFGYVGGSHCGPHHAAKLKDAGASVVFASWAEASKHLAAR